MNIIKTNSISYEKIREDLAKYVIAHKDDERWLSFMESNAGSIIIELIAGLGAYRAYYDLMAERESTLETAITPSAILEHAADRGMLLAPTHSAILTVTVKATENLTVIRGNQIGLLSDYELYATESFSILKGEEKELDCVVGHINKFEREIAGFGNFDTYEFFLKDDMAASEFESLIVNDREVALQSDLNYLETNKGEFVLRRVLPKEVRIYSGNGILGYADQSANSFTYTVLSYGRDLEVKLPGATPSLYISAAVIGSKIKGTPDYAIDAERVRGIARYYPIDGRIVTDQDYMSAIQKYFGGGIHDVYAYNSDPNEEIYVIVKDYTTEGDIQEMKDMIDSKRAMGMKINYYIVRESEGKVMDCAFKIADTDYTVSIDAAIQDYMDTLRFRYIRKNKSISTWEFAAELSNYLGITVKAEKDNTLSLQLMDFIKQFNITVKTVPAEVF